MYLRFMSNTEINGTYPCQSFINFNIFSFQNFQNLYQKYERLSFILIIFSLSDAFNDNIWGHEKGTKLFGIVLGLKAQIIKLLRDNIYIRHKLDRKIK